MATRFSPGYSSSSTSTTCTCSTRPCANEGRVAIFGTAGRWCSGVPARTAVQSLVADALAPAAGWERSQRVCWRAYRWHTEQLRTGSQPVVTGYRFQEKLDCLSDRRRGLPTGRSASQLGFARERRMRQSYLRLAKRAAIGPGEVSISGVAGLTVSRSLWLAVRFWRCRFAIECSVQRDVALASDHTPSVAIRPAERPRVVQALFKSCWRGIAIQALTPPGSRSSQRSCIHHIASNT